MLHIEAVLSGGIVPVPKRWTFEECGENSHDACDFRRLLEASGFWSQPSGDPLCHPDQQRLYLRVRDSGREREMFLPMTGCDASMQALGDFVAARIAWSPKNSA